MRRENDYTEQRSSGYRIERNILSLKFDSLTAKYSDLDSQLFIIGKKNKMMEAGYDSMKKEFYKSQNASTIKNKPILYYNVHQLDSFWQSLR